MSQETDGAEIAAVAAESPCWFELLVAGDQSEGGATRYSILQEKRGMTSPSYIDWRYVGHSPHITSIRQLGCVCKDKPTTTSPPTIDINA